MRALILGGKGQLGRGLAATAPAGAEIVAHDIDTLDITDPTAVGALVAGLRPDLIGTRRKARRRQPSPSTRPQWAS